MILLKKANGVLYLIVLVCSILNFIDDVFHTRCFTFISATEYWNYIAWLFLLFFILSIISLFKKGLIFKYVPYSFYILFIIITVASLIVHWKEDLQ